ncbi:hypothetical protein PHMEG_0004647 [Phytophthora megakarya]|uniref:Spc7 kinetochore protein domain-containing protein n=1 Tax=Phytophthora megakarya TaxID=4795 RepID=A0A225WVD8_9STRA|nr:hypothetical protein PHMEG_0004647 [Phytophthora megakarya]
MREQKTEELSPSNRRTLSPTTARHLLEATDDAISRRDTVSPTALKAVLKTAEEVEETQTAELEAKSSEKSDSFTDVMFVPNLLEQDAGRRSTLDPAEAASVVMALQKEARRLSSSALETESSTESDSEPIDLSDEKARKWTKESNRAPLKNRKSPTASKEKRTTSKETESRKSSSPVKETKSTKAPKPTKINTERRMTIDPSDALMMLDNLQQEDDRCRQTIDEIGLLELTRRESVASGEKELVRKRIHDSDARGGSPDKRARSDSDNNDDHIMESMVLGSCEQAVFRSDPTEKSQPQTSSRYQRSPYELPPSRITKPSLLSPPPGGTRVRGTPLKGILSARKGPRSARDAAQTTPNKSVNFGPSQSAEFNHGSPSTSMTPMLAKDASRLFPLDHHSSEEEPDDAETSLNSSILDEADSLDEKEPKKIRVHQITQIKKPGFDLLQSRRSSLMAPKSTDKKNRRHSMRGYSPLVARAEIRRRRRQTINVPRQYSKSATVTTALTATKKPTITSQSPSTTRRNAFLRPADAQKTSCMRYADSSESSDAGEDMEITGDYADTFEAAGNKAASFTGLPRDEDTAEFSLGHLLAESSMYELTKSVPEPDLHDLPGSLGDLANEVTNAHSSQGSQVTNVTQSSHDQTAALDSIEEANENIISSRNQSAMSMSLVSDNSDDDDVASRKSLQVNLKSQFDRVSDPIVSPRRPPCEAPSVSLITMEDLLLSVALNEDNTLVELSDSFFGEEAESFNNQTSKNVKLACSSDRCSEVIEHHTQEISSWSLNMAQELSSLLHIKAPAIFSPANLDDAGREAIQELYATDAIVARTGWCQLQAQIEQQLTNSLSQGADELATDVKSLKDSVASDVLNRKNELTVIKERIDREEQMALLLDAIEEQQGVHEEYLTAVENLVKECSSLSLEESVLQSRLKVLEGRAAELEPVTSVSASLFEQEVVATEEMLAIQESMSVWEIHEATASLLRISARFEDVLFDVEICVDVHLGSSTTGGASTSIKANESLKRREGNTYLPYEGDVVLVLQRLLLNPLYISQIAEESELGAENDGRVCSKLQVLERFISRSFRLLNELRELSTHFAMRYDEDGSMLWVDFLKFSSVVARIDVEGAEFSIGFSLLPIFPFTDYQTAVRAPRGQVHLPRSRYFR